ncbi:hypothetical protein U9M48_005549 [Paspalum notatum var. saurae]|uniref:RING-type domain-containing protein n=1 Tax=Paspalum notatum var. saurae TaxID=547442 RepID=A0AAQ3PSH6_PASNO
MSDPPNPLGDRLVDPFAMAAASSPLLPTTVTVVPAATPTPSPTPIPTAVSSADAADPAAARAFLSRLLDSTRRAALLIGHTTHSGMWHQEDVPSSRAVSLLGSDVETELSIDAIWNLQNISISGHRHHLICRWASAPPRKRQCVPASTKAILGLQQVATSPDQSHCSAANACAICLEDLFHVEEDPAAEMTKLRAMPCIFGWLRCSSACPLCRHQLPTEEEGGAGGGSLPSRFAWTLDDRRPAAAGAGGAEFAARGR